MLNFLQWTTLNIASKCRFFFMLKHLWAPKRSWKIYHVGAGKVLDFLSVKEWDPVYSAICREWIRGNQSSSAQWLCFL